MPRPNQKKLAPKPPEPERAVAIQCIACGRLGPIVVQSSRANATDEARTAARAAGWETRDIRDVQSIVCKECAAKVKPPKRHLPIADASADD